MSQLSLFYDPTLTWDKVDIGVRSDEKDPDVCRIYIHRRTDGRVIDGTSWLPRLNYACFTFRLSSYQLRANVGFFAMMGTMLDGVRTSSRQKEYEMSMRLRSDGRCVRLEGIDTLHEASSFCVQMPTNQLIDMNTAGTTRIRPKILDILCNKRIPSTTRPLYEPLNVGNTDKRTTGEVYRSQQERRKKDHAHIHDVFWNLPPAVHTVFTSSLTLKDRFEYEWAMLESKSVIRPENNIALEFPRERLLLSLYDESLVPENQDKRERFWVDGSRAYPLQRPSDTEWLYPEVRKTGPVPSVENQKKYTDQTVVVVNYDRHGNDCHELDSFLKRNNVKHLVLVSAKTDIKVSYNIHLFGARTLESVVFLTPYIEKVDWDHGWLCRSKELRAVDFSGMCSLQTVGPDWMTECAKLTTITFGTMPNLKHIGQRWTSNCSALKHLNLSGFAALTSVGEGWLQTTPKLTNSGIVNLSKFGGNKDALCEGWENAT
jgi:hypothetical protein